MQQILQTYLDYNATTPVDPQVVEVMLPFFSVNFGNAASTMHVPGRSAAEAVAKARQQVAELLTCEANELIFTSGATESINLAIKGVAAAYSGQGKHLITWATEHRAVLDVYRKLETKGYEITILPVNREGHADPDVYRKHLRNDTILTSMMLANNETGVIHPIAEFSKIAHEHGCIFFCDATQAPGKIRIDIGELGVDLLSVSAHKMYGPKGTGALFVRRKSPRVILEAQMDGGGHENGLRSGTLNVPGIAGFGFAAKLAMENLWDDSTRISRLRTLLEQILTTNGIGYVNGDIKNRLPNTTNIFFPGFKASTLITKLPGLAVATGSACSSALPEPSHVLKAMGLSDEQSYSSIRFSLGRNTTEDEIHKATEAILQVIAKN